MNKTVFVFVAGLIAGTMAFSPCVSAKVIFGSKSGTQDKLSSQAIKEKAAKEKALKDQEVKKKAAKNKAKKNKASKKKATNDKAAKDKAVKVKADQAVKSAPAKTLQGKDAGCKGMKGTADTKVRK